ncbi:hypothetical protein [Rhodopirellula europaea]|uniref:Uncharacterized protein n=1 Tax=Rhodopirellula europaea 6C TaxID=1263867 RepID=M2B3Z8_9BACT|nr:hypothetical protein [Rhodopirellula europaea]EMB16934.1 hypothetical protein RE6C_02337 [Rhodopirellula europaea 6C]
MNFDRMWEVVKRNVNPFKGANKPKLIALDRLIQEIGTNFGSSFTRLREVDWAYAQFNFKWVQSLTEPEYQEFRGMWLSCFQSHNRPGPHASQAAASPNFHQLAAANPALPATKFPIASASHRFADVVSDADRARMLSTLSDDEFWNGLQFLKEKYQKIASDRNLGNLRKAFLIVQGIGNSAADRLYQNKYFGEYAAKADLINNIYDDAAANGPQSSLENQLLVAGGLWRVVKTTLSLAFGGIVMHASISPMHVLKKSLGALNALAGMVAGLTDLLLGKDANFQPLTGRLGIDAMIEGYKKKLLGPGSHRDGDTIRRQMEDGPTRLVKSSDITIYDLDKVRDLVKRSLWWCKVWEKDIKELRRDSESDFGNSTLASELKDAVGDKAASEVVKLNAAIDAEKAKQNEKIKTLEAKLASSKAFYGERLTIINDLLAASETRLSIARKQAKSAAAGHSFDIMRQIAVEASTFDRANLNPVKPSDVRREKPVWRKPAGMTRKSVLEEIEATIEHRNRSLSIASFADGDFSLEAAA